MIVREQLMDDERDGKGEEWVRKKKGQIGRDKEKGLF